MSDLVAAYLFCAGAGSGAVFLAVALELVPPWRRRLLGALGPGGAPSSLPSSLPSSRSSSLPNRSRSFARVRTAVFAVAFCLLALAALCLLFDLGRPEVAFKLFMRPHATLMTFGAWALALLLANVALLAVLDVFALGGVGAPGALGVRRGAPFARATYARGARRAVGGISAASSGVGGVGASAPAGVGAEAVARGVLLVVALVLSVCVMAYAGLLLRDVGTVPLWNTALLPVLFVASALTSGLAVLVLCAVVVLSVGRKTARLSRLAARIGVGLTLVEAAVAAAYLWVASQGEAGWQTIAPLLAGEQSGLFVGGFLLLGMVAPFVLDAARARGGAPAWSAPLASTFALVGALCLRFCLIHAGVLPPDAVIF